MNNSLMNEHIKRAKLNKAVDLYGTSNEMFKNKFSIESVSEFFNLVFRNAIISQNWCTAIIKLIPNHFAIGIIDHFQYRSK